MDQNDSSLKMDSGANHSNACFVDFKGVGAGGAESQDSVDKYRPDYRKYFRPEILYITYK